MAALDNALALMDDATLVSVMSDLLARFSEEWRKWLEVVLLFDWL